MKRLAAHSVPVPVELRQIIRFLMDQEGLCTCGRVLRKLEPKLFLAAGDGPGLKMGVGLYCLQCAGAIQDRLFDHGQIATLLGRGLDELLKVLVLATASAELRGLSDGRRRSCRTRWRRLTRLGLRLTLARRRGG